MVVNNLWTGLNFEVTVYPFTRAQINSCKLAVKVLNQFLDKVYFRLSYLIIRSKGRASLKVFAKKLDGAREERERGVFMAPEHHPATFKVKFS